MEELGDMQAVIEAAELAATPVELKPGRLYGTAKTIVWNTENYATVPNRKRGVVTVYDAVSLNLILAQNQDAGHHVVYVDRDLENPTIVAVLNSNGPAGPGWGDFLAKIEFRPTPQWLKWRAIDGKMMSQATFAEFIEDNLADLASPPGAEMLEIVTYLTATRSTDFKSAVRLSSGAVQFQNLESVDAKVGAGQIAVPETFQVALSPFIGSALYPVPTRFRYRLEGGKLTLGIKLQRVETLMEAVISDVVSAIAHGDNVTLVEGQAPGPVSS